jgi:cytochrome c biogenesis protein CcdA
MGPQNMIDLLPGLLPLLFVDVLNPVLFALMVVAVGSSKPVANSVALLSGHTAAYFISGIVIAVGLEKITVRLENPLPVDFVIEILIGLLCIWAALKSRDGKASETKSPEAELTPMYCFGYGAVINFIGVPFALPYFAAVGQILMANLTLDTSLLVLAIYNAAYALPFLSIPIAVVLVGDRCKPFLEKTNDMLIRLVDTLMPIFLLLIGLALTADAVAYFSTGKPLW